MSGAPIRENPKRPFGPGEVSGKLAIALFDLLRSVGLPLDGVAEGLSFDARSIRRRRFVPWDEYGVLIERAEAVLGGPERAHEKVLRSYHAVLPPEFKALFGAFASPRLLYRFLCSVVGPATFPVIEMAYRELSGGSLRISLRLTPGARPCLTFMRMSVASISGFCCHLGLPPAEVEVEEVSGLALLVLVRPPDSRTLLARTMRAARPAIHRSALRAMEKLSWRSGDPDPGAPVPRGQADDRVRAAQTSLGLTVRQAEVLAQLIRGRSNKEIAGELNCAESTVESHVTQLLRKAGVDSRSQLIASLL
jgi:DNA-binding CsgD family transcriptional regulator